MNTPLLHPAATDLTCSIARYSYFHGVLHIAGYVFSPTSRVGGVGLLFGGRTIPLLRFDLPSPDLTRTFGRNAAACRFDEALAVGADMAAAISASLIVTLTDGRCTSIPMGQDRADNTCSTMMPRFFKMLADLRPGRLLEIGSRARTGTVLTANLPPGWTYTGLDIVEAPNVDVVCDAHRASDALPWNSFDAVISMVVFEHLLMPWKAAIEINRVLKVGALGLIMAPQTWPLHEEPCDYFRFSKHAWKSLFNRGTGFEIIDTAQSQRTYIVAQHLTAAANFGEMHTGALMSAVLFRKIADTTIDWRVEMADVSEDIYPD